MSYYLGYIKDGGGKVRLFTSNVRPTELSHGHLYLAVIGPFRTYSETLQKNVAIYGDSKASWWRPLAEGESIP